MASLVIFVVAKIDTIESTRGIRVCRVRFVGCFDKGTKSKLAVLGIVQVALMENHSGTVEFGYTMFCWKKIELFGALLDQDLDHCLGQSVVR